jgi:hypothetical protein
MKTDKSVKQREERNKAEEIYLLKKLGDPWCHSKKYRIK